jgi:hypothetical protein
LPSDVLYHKLPIGGYLRIAAGSDKQIGLFSGSLHLSGKGDNMQRKINVLVVIGCLLIGSIVLSGISMLMNFDKPGEIDMDKLSQGRMGHILLTSTFWSQYPSSPAVEKFCVLFQLRAFLLTGPFIFGAYYFLRYRKKCSFLMVGLASLLAGFVAYLTGWVALIGNTDPSNCGPWVATMLIGVLYSTLACAAFVGAGIARNIRMGHSSGGFAKATPSLQ